MRHGRKINHLSRTASHRKAMLSNMASSLIIKKRINTTLAKAKALRKYVEPLITRSKDDSTHSRRLVFKYLQDKSAVTELFREVSGKVAERPGGYTRIIKMGNRLGDQAEMALIELVDFNDLMVKEEKPKKAKRSRRGRKSGAAKAAAAVTTTAEEVADEVSEKAEEVTEAIEEKVEDAKEKVEAKAEESAEEVEKKDEKSKKADEDNKEDEGDK